MTSEDIKHQLIIKQLIKLSQLGNTQFNIYVSEVRETEKMGEEGVRLVQTLNNNAT